MDNFIFGRLPYIIGGVLDNADNGECNKSLSSIKSNSLIFGDSQPVFKNTEHFHYDHAFRTSENYKVMCSPKVSF